MEWALLLLIVIAVLAVLFPGFRYFALIAVVLAGGGYYVLLESEWKAAEESRERYRGGSSPAQDTRRSGCCPRDAASNWSTPMRRPESTRSSSC